MIQALLTSSYFIYATLGGLLSAVVWLWFWLKEDPHPEPKRVLIRTFFTGVLVLPIALFLEEVFFEGGVNLGFIAKNSFHFWILFVWAGIEEIAKYSAAYWAALIRPGFDEPIDAPIYLITAALGFAAFENSIFLFKAFREGFAAFEGPMLGLITSQLRFIGATLLHVTTSAIVGISIAYAFFHPEKRHRNVIGGLFTATLLHTFFNFFILKEGGEKVLIIFFAVWITAIALIFILEKIKRLKV